MNWKIILSTVVVSLAMTACGGGGDPGKPLFGEDPPVVVPTVTAQSIEVLASAAQIASGSTDEVAITAVVKGAGNVVLADAPVSFTTSSGSLTVLSATTDASGTAKATVKAGTTLADKANRTITVTATSGTRQSLIDIPVVGTTLAYSGPASLSRGSSPAAMSVIATDSRGQPIANAQISVSASAIGNTLSSATLTTNSSGVAAFTYTPLNNGADSLTFTGLGALPVAAALTVSGEDFVFVSPTPNTSVNVGASQTLTVRYRVNGVAQVGRTVNFASTAGTLNVSSQTTDGSGSAQVTISSNFAGRANVSASIAGVTTISLPLEFVATTPGKLVLQISPTALSPNAAGSTTQQATVLARVTDASDNPVKNQVVNFTRVADSSGGDLSQASATTDSNGLASVKYISGPNSTASGGVVLKAQVQGYPSVNDTENLTVNQSALFIALGTGNTIENVDLQTYKKDWTVYVTDANGVSVPGVTLTMRVLPIEYGKGSMVFSDDASLWITRPYTGAASTTSELPTGTQIWCTSEDANNNGNLDPLEDGNGNTTLEPGNVISVTPSTVTTDSSGRGTVSLIYAESYHPWVRVTLRATATVAGTESRKDATFVVPASSGDLSSKTVTPAGVLSPFGVVASCGSPL